MMIDFGTALDWMGLDWMEPAFDMMLDLQQESLGVGYHSNMGINFISGSSRAIKDTSLNPVLLCFVLESGVSALFET